MVSACRAIGQRLSKGGHSRRHLGGAHSYTLPLTTCLQRRHEMQLLLGAYNSWGEAATPFKQTKRTHNRQVIQFSVWWAPGKSVLNDSDSSISTCSLVWSCRVTPLRVRSWRGAFTTSPHGSEFAAGSGFECRSHGATNLGFLPHSTLVGLTHCSCSRSLARLSLCARPRVG